MAIIGLVYELDKDTNKILKNPSLERILQELELLDGDIKFGIDINFEDDEKDGHISIHSGSEHEKIMLTIMFKKDDKLLNYVLLDKNHLNEDSQDKLEFKVGPHEPIGSYPAYQSVDKQTTTIILTHFFEHGEMPEGYQWEDWLKGTRVDKPD